MNLVGKASLILPLFLIFTHQDARVVCMQCLSTSTEKGRVSNGSLIHVCCMQVNLGKSDSRLVFCKSTDLLAVVETS